jgi:hypothetical protein
MVDREHSLLKASSTAPKMGREFSERWGSAHLDVGAEEDEEASTSAVALVLEEKKYLRILYYIHTHTRGYQIPPHPCQ